MDSPINMQQHGYLISTLKKEKRIGSIAYDYYDKSLLSNGSHRNSTQNVNRQKCIRLVMNWGPPDDQKVVEIV